MCVVMVFDILKASVRDRAKVTIALINYWSCTSDVLESVNAKAIIGVAKKRAMLAC